jgi:serine/threonine protein kinase
MTDVRTKVIGLSYHNIDIMTNRTNLLNDRYSINNPIKMNYKRAIYDAYDNTEKKRVVLKFIVESCVTNEKYRIFNFFMQQTHPNFCKINEIFHHQAFWVLVMDYIEGETLDVYFDKKHTNIEYYRILFDLIFSLDYIHDHKIMHGDIKPENIVVTTDGRPIIIDYDLSRFVDGEQSTDKIFGTRFYMPPELVSKKQISVKSDIWSLGMTLCITTMKKFIPDIFNKIIDCINDDRITYKYPKKILPLISPYLDKSKSVYGKLFTNTIIVMLLENSIDRPSSRTISSIFKKSKYYDILYLYDKSEKSSDSNGSYDDSDASNENIEEDKSPINNVRTSFRNGVLIDQI